MRQKECVMHRDGWMLSGHVVLCNITCRLSGRKTEIRQKEQE